MRKITFGVICSFILLACNNKPAETTTSTDADSTGKMKQQQTEFADAKYADIGKNRLRQMESGDIDAWLDNFADNAVYVWSRGDSLAGKAAISAYWKNRRMNVIDSISFSNDIWYPIKINQPQKAELPGIWLLGWYQIDAKFKKTGKKLTYWVHSDLHFDSNDKIDRAVQYTDRAPLMAASGEK